MRPPRRRDAPPIIHYRIATGPDCGGSLQMIACIEDPEVIDAILTHIAA